MISWLFTLWCLFSYVESFIPSTTRISTPLGSIEHGKMHREQLNMMRREKLNMMRRETTFMGLKPLKIIIAGSPAAGKGTQCEVIKQRYGVIHLSTGDMLRAAVQANTPLGMKAKGFMESGKLVPDELIIDLVCDRLNEEDCKTKGWLLDGFPRTNSQAEELSNRGISPDSFILLDVPEDILVERVTGRRTDPVTGKIYHMKFSPPENDEIRLRLVQRKDDTAETVKIRYQEFSNHINAVKGKYESILIWIDGSQSKDKVSYVLTDSLDSIVPRV